MLLPTWQRTDCCTFLSLCIKSTHWDYLKKQGSAIFLPSIYENSGSKFSSRSSHYSWWNRIYSLRISWEQNGKRKEKIFHFSRSVQISICQVKFLQSIVFFCHYYVSPLWASYSHVTTISKYIAQWPDQWAFSIQHDPFPSSSQHKGQPKNRLDGHVCRYNCLYSITVRAQPFRMCQLFK